MTRKEVLILNLNEIKTLRLKCKECGTVLSFPVKAKRPEWPTCPVCGTRIPKELKDYFFDLWRAIDNISEQDPMAIELEIEL